MRETSSDFSGSLGFSGSSVVSGSVPFVSDVLSVFLWTKGLVSLGLLRIQSLVSLWLFLLTVTFL